MKRKIKSPFSVDPGLEDSKTKSSKKKAPKDKKDLRKTSYDPLYDTTDQYRKVCKPMDVEDFLPADQ